MATLSTSVIVGWWPKGSLESSEKLLTAVHRSGIKSALAGLGLVHQSHCNKVKGLHGHSHRQPRQQACSKVSGNAFLHLKFAGMRRRLWTASLQLPTSPRKTRIPRSGQALDTPQRPTSQQYHSLRKDHASLRSLQFYCILLQDPWLSQVSVCVCAVPVFLSHRTCVDWRMMSLPWICCPGTREDKEKVHQNGDSPMEAGE